MKSLYFCRSCLFCPLQVTPSLWLPTVPDATASWKNILELCNLFSKNVHLLYLLLPQAESDHSHEAVCTLRVQTSSRLSYFIIFPLSLFPYCQCGGFFYEPLLTKPCLIVVVQTVKPRCIRDFNTQHEHVSQGSTILFLFDPLPLFLGTK